MLVFLIWASQLQSFAKRWQHFPSFSVTWEGSCGTGSALRFCVSTGWFALDGVHHGSLALAEGCEEQAEMVRPARPQALPGCRGAAVLGWELCGWALHAG